MMRQEQKERFLAFTEKLQDYREAERLTQDEMAAVLGISRKTYIFFEQARWMPGDRQDHHMIHTLHKLDPALAEAYAHIFPTSPEAFGIVREVPRPAAAARPSLGAKEARRAYDAALYRVAEDQDMPPKTLRPIVAAVLSELHDSGMSLEQAVEMAKHAADSRSRSARPK